MEVVTPCGRRVYTYRRVLVLGASEDGVERAHRVLLLALRCAASHAPGAKHSCVCGRRSDQAGSGRDRARGGRAAGDAPGAGRGRARGDDVGGGDGVHSRVFLRWVVRLVVERASKIDEPRGQDNSGPPRGFAIAWQRGAGQSRVHRTTPPTGRVSQTSRTCSRSRRSRSSSPSTSARVAPTDVSPVRNPSSSRRRALKR